MIVWHQWAWALIVPIPLSLQLDCLFFIGTDIYTGSLPLENGVGPTFPWERTVRTSKPHVGLDVSFVKLYLGLYCNLKYQKCLGGLANYKQMFFQLTSFSHILSIKVSCFLGVLLVYNWAKLFLLSNDSICFQHNARSTFNLVPSYSC